MNEYRCFAILVGRLAIENSNVNFLLRVMTAILMLLVTLLNNMEISFVPLMVLEILLVLGFLRF